VRTISNGEGVEMSFRVTATQPMPKSNLSYGREWLEAEEDAESLDDAIEIIRRRGRAVRPRRGSIPHHRHPEEPGGRKPN